MTKVTFLGGDEAVIGNVGYISWPEGPPGNQREVIFPLNKAVEVKNPHILAKIRGMEDKGWFKIEEDKPETFDTKTAPGGGAGDDASAESGEENGETGHGGGGGLRGSRQRKIT